MEVGLGFPAGLVEKLSVVLEARRYLLAARVFPHHIVELDVVDRRLGADVWFGSCLGV